MQWLLDTNIPLRWAQPNHPHCPIAELAVNRLLDRGDEVFLTPHNLIEFWNVATRPQDVNGLGLSPAETAAKVERLEAIFPLALDTLAVYPVWRSLVTSANIIGVRVHDARLVAVMQVHGLTHLLTFDTGDFQCFNGITVVHPQDV